ncbi:hypothetical protein [Anoxybacillus gonensis]|uniref:hypothetical protein n=1 Tax=Anoxybacillus gonensis TaxID=198467 RepID=UPI0002BD9E7E|nr:hypothetical protein [Anoxybacillus gonensis]EMI09549.1 blue (type 1) copper domain protein [Anoxybacillus gonensis]
MKKFMVYVCLTIFALFTFQGTYTKANTDSDLNKLVELGIVKENEKQKIKNVNEPMKKIDAYILYIRLAGLESKAKSFRGKNTYKDIKQIPKEYVPYVNYAKANPKLGWDKKSDTFQPRATLTIKEFTKYMLDLLGYIPDRDYLAEEQMEFAQSIYLLSKQEVERANSKLTIKDAYAMILKAMKVFNKQGQLFSTVLENKKIVNGDVVKKYNLHISSEETNAETKEIDMEVEEVK